MLFRSALFFYRIIIQIRSYKYFAFWFHFICITIDRFQNRCWHFFRLLLKLFGLSCPFFLLFKQRRKTFFISQIIWLSFPHIYQLFSNSICFINNFRKCKFMDLSFFGHLRVVKSYSILDNSSNLSEHSSEIFLKLRS